MFTASITQTDYLGAALQRSAGGTLIYQPGLYGGAQGYGTIALSGANDLGFGCASDCMEDRRFPLAPDAVNQGLTLLNQGTNPLWLVETASGLQFAASAPPEPLESLPFAGTGASVGHNGVSAPHLAVLVRKARAFGAPVLRQGIASIQLNTGAAEWALIECLADSTWVSLYRDGRLMSRHEYPALSAYALLRELQFDSILL